MILSDLGICNNVKLCYNSTMQRKTIAHIRNAYREEFGGFKAIEDIMNIPGIKEGMFSKIKDQICVK